MTEMEEGGWVRVERELHPAIDDPWFEHPVWGCDQGHASTRFLKSEALGRDACLACRGEIFPIERAQVAA